VYLDLKAENIMYGAGGVRVIDLDSFQDPGSDDDGGGPIVCSFPPPGLGGHGGLIPGHLVADDADVYAAYGWLVGMVLARIHARPFPLPRLSFERRPRDEPTATTLAPLSRAVEQIQAGWGALLSLDPAERAGAFLALLRDDDDDWELVVTQTFTAHGPGCTVAIDVFPEPQTLRHSDEDYVFRRDGPGEVTFRARARLGGCGMRPADLALLRRLVRHLVQTGVLPHNEDFGLVAEARPGEDGSTGFFGHADRLRHTGLVPVAVNVAGIDHSVASAITRDMATHADGGGLLGLDARHAVPFLLYSPRLYGSGPDTPTSTVGFVPLTQERLHDLL